MGKVELLDCTLRDGGHVNNANFGEACIHGITDCLTQSNIDYIELGFLRNGSFSSDESNYNCIQQASKFKSALNPKQKYTVMIRPDWYDISQLNCLDSDIGIIRFAFYHKDIALTQRYCDYAQRLGYKCILNPVNIMSYSSEELKELINEINTIHPMGMTMVDTFGAMTTSDLERIYTTCEELISPDLFLNLHLHENLSSSFHLAQYFLQLKNPERNSIIDGSLYGMGRIPGNLCIEIIMDYLNCNFQKEYDVLPVVYAISKYIEPIKLQRNWGYSPAYYLTGKEMIHRSYAEYLLDNKTDLELNEVFEILYMLKDDSSKLSFSKELIEKLYIQYKEKKNEKKSG